MTIHPYSIQKIVKIAYRKFGMKPGEWYTPNRILFALQYIHQGDPDNKAECSSERNPLRGYERNPLQGYERNPLQGYEQMRVQIFLNDRPMVLQDMVMEFCQDNYKPCQCQKPGMQQPKKKSEDISDQLLVSC